MPGLAPPTPPVHRHLRPLGIGVWDLGAVPDRPRVSGPGPLPGGAAEEKRICRLFLNKGREFSLGNPPFQPDGEEEEWGVLEEGGRG